MWVLGDTQWAELAPLVEECRPRGKTGHRDLRQTVVAIVWRHRNGAAWRSIPAEFGPWWAAAQTFIRWARLGVWERLLEHAQRRGVALGMVFLDGTGIRAHHKVAGAKKEGADGKERDAREALGLGRLPGPDLGHGRAAGDPAETHRCAGRLPAVDLCQPPSRREPLGQAQGEAHRRPPL